MIRGNDSQVIAEYVPALLLALASSAFCRSRPSTARMSG